MYSEDDLEEMIRIQAYKFDTLVMRQTGTTISVPLPALKDLKVSTREFRLLMTVILGDKSCIQCYGVTAPFTIASKTRYIKDEEALLERQKRHSPSKVPNAPKRSKFTTDEGYFSAQLKVMLKWAERADIEQAKVLYGDMGEELHQLHHIIKQKENEFVDNTIN